MRSIAWYIFNDYISITVILIPSTHKEIVNIKKKKFTFNVTKIFQEKKLSNMHTTSQMSCVRLHDLRVEKLERTLSYYPHCTINTVKSRS